MLSDLFPQHVMSPELSLGFSGSVGKECRRHRTELQPQDWWTISDRCLSCPAAENKEGTDSPLGVETICPSIIWLTQHPSPFPNNYLSSPFPSLLPWNIFPLCSQGYKKRVGWGYTVWSWGGSGNPKRNLIFRSIQDFPTTGSILGSFETT